MRAAWVVSDLTCLRLGRTLGSLADGLTDRGVELVGVCGSDASHTALSEWATDVVKSPMRRWFRPGRMVASLADKLRQKGVQILHALDAEAGATTALLAGELGCPHVVSSYCLGDGRLIGRMDVRPAMVLAAGLAVKLDLVNSHCIPPSRVAVAPPAVRGVSDGNAFRQREHCRSVVTSDVFDDYGAAAAVLDAFARVNMPQTECLLFAVGNGPAEHMLRKHAEELGLGSSLTFVDRLDSRQLSGVFQTADIYISPRGANSVNLDALFAMASGAAVMAPEDHVSDFLIDGQTASIFRSRDARDIAEHLADMLENREKTATLAAGALGYLEEKHRHELTVQQVAGAYRAVLAAESSHVPLLA